MKSMSMYPLVPMPFPSNIPPSLSPSSPRSMMKVVRIEANRCATTAWAPIRVWQWTGSNEFGDQAILERNYKECWKQVGELMRERKDKLLSRERMI